ncbi:Na+/H+ antiporter NhaC family protein [Abyssisolibacter fermentans]|uniref:Na+/H+ antiporter NhaC family protein n=1 Tax=Abyssisolibacter fermentans TaxID=1766203 RepID=UPI00082B85E5|nr:Na+/H+ antiporter NhaC family protein [Abyssisolibacter fermentans]
MELSWVSVVPVLLVIILAFAAKNVFIALLSGIIVSGIILDVKLGTIFTGLNSIYQVFQDDWAVKSILFCLMIGAFVYVIEATGGVNGMVEYLTEKRKLVKSKIGAQLLAYLLGVFLFIDGTSSIVISGVASKPLFDRFDVSREKLAYIIDSTSSPIAWFIPFNAAGAFLMAMVGGQVSAGIIEVDPMTMIISAMPFQFYGIFSILIVGVVIFINKDRKIGEKRSIWNAKGEELEPYSSQQIFQGNIVAKAKNMLIPLVLLVGSIFGIMLITGKGNILKGDGSAGIYIGAILTLILTGVYYIVQGIIKAETYLKWVLKGMSNYLEVTMILTLAFAFSNLVSQLKTGTFIATISSGVNPAFVPFMIFIAGAFMSFATGTSGGTVAVLIPIAIPMAANLGASIPIVIGAIISGGVFGDHCSPISDSTILSSMIAEIDVMDHVKTQIPYTLISAALAGVGFLAIGIIS